MLLNIVVIFSTALLSSVLAQSVSSTTTRPTTTGPTTTGSTTSSSTSTAAIQTHTIAVGADGFNFYPQQTYASVGDTIEWQFYPYNHSVVRAAYGDQPCIPYEWSHNAPPGAVGFWSGFVPVNTVLKNPPSFQVTVNDTAPIFFYCSQTYACFEGMIGVINPNATETFANQMAWALNTTEEFSPGQSFLPEGQPPVTRTTTYTGATAAPTAPPATTSSTAPVQTKTSSSLPIGAIVGIAIGGFAVLVLAAALIYMCGRQKTVKEIMRQSALAPTNHNSYQPTSSGFSEANYPNMQKSPNMSGSRDGHFSAQTFASPPTERSMSPPFDERANMMGMHPLNAGSQGYPSPGLMSPGMMSPGMMSPNSPGFPGSPVYNDNVRHEMGAHGIRPFNPSETGPHELAVPTANNSPQDEHRPFSYTDSESGYMRPEKSETDTY